MAKYIVLAEGSFSYLYSKTGNTLIRYSPNDVVGVIDSRFAGKTSQDVIGYGGDIPVVSNLDAVLSSSPDTMVLGNAPQGGRITDVYRKHIVQALTSGLHIISGMHQFISGDPYFMELAQSNNVTIRDLRKPPNPPHFPKQSWKERKTPVLLTVGSDCDTGKMTTAWEITKGLKQEGIDARFIGTGQTGILLSGQGVPIDAVVSDFMAGELEYVIDQNLDADIIIVEGQGAINNMLYSGVTLGLIHGSMPNYFLMCHEPVRTRDVSDYPIPQMRYLFALHLQLMEPFRNSEFVGINLLTHAMSESKAKEALRLYETENHCIATDIVRFGGEPVIDVLKEKLGR